MSSLIRSAWFKSSGIVATPGYSVFITSWTGSTDNLTWTLLVQGSYLLGGGRATTNNTAQNNYIVWNEWLDAGTYKYAQIHQQDTNSGIYSVQFNGSTQGTIDGYGTTVNTYAEITGIAVSAGLKAVKLLMATKNASAGGYSGDVNSGAFIRTGA